MCDLWECLEKPLSPLVSGLLQGTWPLGGIPLEWPAPALYTCLPPSPALHSSQNLGGPGDAMGGLPGTVNVFDLPSTGWMLSCGTVCILIRAFRVNTSYSGAVPEA